MQDIENQLCQLMHNCQQWLGESERSIEEAMKKRCDEDLKLDAKMIAEEECVKREQAKKLEELEEQWRLEIEQKRSKIKQEHDDILQQMVVNRLAKMEKLVHERESWHEEAQKTRKVQVQKILEEQRVKRKEIDDLVHEFEEKCRVGDCNNQLAAWMDNKDGRDSVKNEFDTRNGEYLTLSQQQSM